MKLWRYVIVGLGLCLGSLGQGVPEGQELQFIKTGENAAQGTTSWQFSWLRLNGYTYFLRYSFDLIHWENFTDGVDGIWPGNGATFTGNVTTDGPRMFFKIIYTDEAPPPGENAFTADFDLDGLSNEVEVFLSGSDPLSEDTDKDGMPDGWEYNYNLDPNDSTGINGASADIDAAGEGDGLTNLEEFLNGGNPHVRDSDNDGLNDGAEVHVYFTLVDQLDSDGDGFGDGAEVNTYLTNPTTEDSDGDGLTEAQEINEYATNPTVQDTDDDTLKDGEDAMPNDALVDWPRTPDYRYAVIPIPGWVSGDGDPLDVNDSGLVVFKRKFWQPGDTSMSALGAPSVNFSVTLPRAAPGQTENFQMTVVEDFEAIRTTNSGHVVGWARVWGASGASNSYVTYRGLLWSPNALGSAPTILHPSNISPPAGSPVVTGSQSAGYYYPMDVDDTGMTAGLEAIVSGDAGAGGGNDYVRSYYRTASRSGSGSFTLLSSYPANNVDTPRPPFEDGLAHLDPKVSMDALGKFVFRDALASSTAMRYLSNATTIGSSGLVLTDVAGVTASLQPSQRVAAAGGDLYLRNNAGAWVNRVANFSVPITYPSNARKVNSIGQVLVGDNQLWYNGKVTSVAELLANSGTTQWTSPNIKGLSSKGWMAGVVIPIQNGQAQPPKAAVASPVEFLQPSLDKHGVPITENETQVLKSASALRLCRWHFAFAPNFDANFYTTDPDRFYVRVKGRNPGDMKLSTAGLNDVKVWQNDAWQAVTSDGEDTITMTKPDPNKEEWLSPPLLLVDGDDDKSYHPGFADDQAGDRTHAAGLGSTVKVKFAGFGEAETSISTETAAYLIKTKVFRQGIVPANKTHHWPNSVQFAREVYRPHRFALDFAAEPVEIDNDAIQGLMITENGAPKLDLSTIGKMKIFGEALRDEGADADTLAIVLLPEAVEAKPPAYMGENFVGMQGFHRWVTNGNAHILYWIVLPMSNYRPSVLAHEIGHALGLNHTTQDVVQFIMAATAPPAQELVHNHTVLPKRLYFDREHADVDAKNQSSAIHWNARTLSFCEKQ